MICRHLPPALRLMPEWFQRHVLAFEAGIEDSLRRFAAELPAGARVLDAGAGEGQYAELCSGFRYVAVDLGIGDTQWSYRALDAVADLEALPFAAGTFEAALNIVTLEHVRHPLQVLCELARVLQAGGRLLLVTPLEWEEHQTPHDYFRYTQYGLEYILQNAGFEVVSLQPAGGYFRLLARRLLVAPQFFPPVAGALIMALVALPGLLLPLLDFMDRKKHFTLGHICVARKL